MKFKPGDKARLHSGGPVVTVARVIDNPMPWETAGEVECVWFVQNALRRDVFRPELLDPVPEH